MMLQAAAASRPSALEGDPRPTTLDRKAGQRGSNLAFLRSWINHHYQLGGSRSPVRLEGVACSWREVTAMMVRVRT